MEFLQGLFATDGFHPHGFCFLWRPALVRLHVASDLLIGFAYLGIGLGLAHFVRKGRGHLPFSSMFVAFGIFIAACGATHFVQVWTLWHPVYWFSGGVKAVTAAASVFTALALPPLIPVALATLASARLSEKRREDLELAHKRLQELDELKTAFFANASHELRTPLALVLGPVGEALAEGRLGEADRRRMDTVQRNAQLLLRLVNDLLDVAKLEAGRVELQYGRTDLALLVRRSTAHFESAAAMRAVTLEVEAPAELPAEVDAARMERVLFNLLGNALAFTPSGGTVRVTLEGMDPEVAEGASGALLIVQDSGPGVPTEQQEAIFQPFRQAQSGGERIFGGTGLGLAIVSDVVKLHGGRVHVEDSPLGGAAFVIQLPLRAPEGVPVVVEALTREEPGEARDGRTEPLVPRAPAAQREAAGEVVGEAGQPLVLVVEDNPEMNAFVTETLSAYRVARAFDGAEGIRKALDLRPDLIVSDIMMPVATGETLVRELRRVPELDATPILLLSARADEPLRLDLLSDGAQDYVTKPFSAEELRIRVRNWMEMKRARDILRRTLDTTRGDVESLAAQVAQRSRELEDALEAARVAFAEADVANRAKTDFLSVMSHELRTPLNGILGYIDLMESGIAGEFGERQLQYLERSKKSARHLLDLVEQVLTFAQFEGGIEDLELEPVDLTEVVQEAAMVVEPAAAQKGLDLLVVTPPEGVVARTHAGKLRQILTNLTANAVKFTKEGRVRVRLEAEWGEARISVEDTGPGIAGDQLGRIFEPFWQAERSEYRIVGGTGLGLAITERLVGLLGGEIDVRSEVGRGTTFVVRLPVDGEGRVSSL